MLNGNVGNVLGAEWMRTGEDKDRCIETILSSVNSASQERSCGKLSMRRLSLACEDIWFEKMQAEASRNIDRCTRIREGC
jgi:hypothetical protein